MIIGIVSRKTKTTYNRDVYSASIPIINKLNEYGVSVISIVPTNDVENIIRICDGVIFPGGEDYYESDFKIMEICDKLNKSVFGICLGMQIMGVYAGGTCEKIGNDSHYDESKTYIHKVVYKDKSYDVNSRHVCNIVGKLNIDIVGRSNDNIIEAIEDNNKRFWLGVQWHPEDLEDELSKELFDSFINSCKNYCKY